MARTRSIKPAFFSNEVLAELPAHTRLLFIGLWTIADRDGRIEDRPKRIKAELFPYDDFDINLMLTELHNYGFIIRYVVSDINLIQINNFARHQNPHPKEQSNDYPEPPEPAENLDAVKLHGNAAKINDKKCLLPITYYPLPITFNPINEVAEKNLNNRKPEKKRDLAQSPKGISFRNWLEALKSEDPAVSPSACPDSLYDEAKRLGFEHSAIAQWEKFHDYWIAKTGQSAVKSDWIATWRNWLRRSFNG